MVLVTLVGGATGVVAFDPLGVFFQDNIVLRAVVEVAVNRVWGQIHIGWSQQTRKCIRW